MEISFWIFRTHRTLHIIQIPSPQRVVGLTPLAEDMMCDFIKPGVIGRKIASVIQAELILI